MRRRLLGNVLEYVERNVLILERADGNVEVLALCLEYVLGLDAMLDQNLLDRLAGESHLLRGRDGLFLVYLFVFDKYVDYAHVYVFYSESTGS